MLPLPNKSPIKINSSSRPMNISTIIVRFISGRGAKLDVHPHNELQFYIEPSTIHRLCRLFEITKNKTAKGLIFIGDLGKGNKPLETFLIYKQTEAICIMGNAELAFLKNYQDPSFLKEYIEPTKKY